VSAVGLAFNIYGTLFMAFLGAAVSVGARVGAALGGLRPGAARLSAFAACSAVPFVWLALAATLLSTPTQRLICSMFVKRGDTQLQHYLSGLLDIIAVLELLDGMQTVMTGLLLSSMLYLYGRLVPA
jgi:Na+-driven multidrug efflux pump